MQSGAHRLIIMRLMIWKLSGGWNAAKDPAIGLMANRFGPKMYSCYLLIPRPAPDQLALSHKGASGPSSAQNQKIAAACLKKRPILRACINAAMRQNCASEMQNRIWNGLMILWRSLPISVRICKNKPDRHHVIALWLIGFAKPRPHYYLHAGSRHKRQLPKQNKPCVRQS